jgi:hypothetical protein
MMKMTLPLSLTYEIGVYFLEITSPSESVQWKNTCPPTGSPRTQSGYGSPKINL